MLIPFVILPNLFNEDLIGDNSRIAENLALLLKSMRNRGILLFDAGGHIDSEIYNCVSDFTNQQNKKKFQIIYKYIKYELRKYEIHTKEFESELFPVCEKVVTIMRNSKDINCVIGVKDCDKICSECIQQELKSENKIYDINNLNDDLIDNLLRMTFTSIQEYDENKLYNDIFKNFVKYSSEIFIYDNQMIPKESRKTRSSDYKIQPNYKYNLEHLLRYMCTVNPNIKINIYLIIKQEQIRYREQIINSFNKVVQVINADYSNAIIALMPINEICLAETQTKILHQRYFMSNHLMFSCDRGIDLINQNTNEVRDFNIAIVDKADEGILKHHFVNDLVVCK